MGKPYVADKMQHSSLSQDTWRQRAEATCDTSEKKPYSQEFLLLIQESTIDYHPPVDRRLRPFGHSPSNSTAVLSTSQQQTLPVHRKMENIASGVQMMEAEEEIDPGDIKYRLQWITADPLQMQPPSYSRYLKPPLPIFSTTHRPYFQPLKTESGVSYGEKPFNSEPPSSWSIPPVNLQGRGLASKEHAGHMEHVNQHQRDFQGPVLRLVLPPLGPDKCSQGVTQHIRQVQKATAPGWSATGVRQDINQPKQRTAVLEGETRAKSDRDTVSKMSTLPPLKPGVKKEKVKFPSHTYELFKAKLQTETTSKQFFQNRVTKSPKRSRPPYRDKKPLLGSQASLQDRTTATTYMPLFSERVKLCKPKSNGTKSEASNLTACTENHPRMRDRSVPALELKPQNTRQKR
ncbi:uncharacterized protein [Dipodomys merriami]|uniref:uncharacterized protein isoform X2 n=1 Tax=Dipodomys merriami TaxID=94247 RepID=UPI003855DE66